MMIVTFKAAASERAEEQCGERAKVPLRLASTTDRLRKSFARLSLRQSVQPWNFFP